MTAEELLRRDFSDAQPVAAGSRAGHNGTLIIIERERQAPSLYFTSMMIEEAHERVNDWQRAGPHDDDFLSEGTYGHKTGPMIGASLDLDLKDDLLVRRVVLKLKKQGE